MKQNYGILECECGRVYGTNRHLMTIQCTCNRTWKLEEKESDEINYYLLVNPYGNQNKDH